MRERPATPVSQHPRITRELKTVKAMIAIYCRDKHESSGHLCDQCRTLVEYAEKRLLHCPFQGKKPTCGKCLVHCYKPEMRERIQSVMRYSGPRMVLHHPILAITHLLDEKLRKPQPLKPGRTKSHSADHPGDDSQ